MKLFLKKYVYVYYSSIIQQITNQANYKRHIDPTIKTQYLSNKKTYQI